MAGHTHIAARASSSSVKFCPSLVALFSAVCASKARFEPFDLPICRCAIKMAKSEGFHRHCAPWRQYGVRCARAVKAPRLYHTVAQLACLIVNYSYGVACKCRGTGKDMEEGL